MKPFHRMLHLCLFCLLAAAVPLTGCDTPAPAPDGSSPSVGTSAEDTAPGIAESAADTSADTATDTSADTSADTATDTSAETAADTAADTEPTEETESQTSPPPEDIRDIPLAEGATLRIMSWNLQCPDKNANDLFGHMQNGILHYGADIIGLQECNKNAHKGVLEKLGDKYAIATVYHSGTTTYDYTPILYNPVRFDLLESGVEWLDGRFTGTNTKCLSWAVLSDRYNSGRKLIVINFHGAVASNKYAGMENMTKDELTAQATAWKIDNIHQLQRKIAALEETFGQASVFVTGDYNTSYGAEPYKLMASYGYLDAEFNAVTSAMSGYKSTHTMGKKPASGKSIDHIFYSPDRGITPYVHSFGMRQSDLDATDHLPLYVDFAIAP